MQPARAPASRVPENASSKPFPLFHGWGRLIFTFVLCIPCAWFATALSDSSLPKAFRYAVSPGTVLALSVTGGPTHTFNDVVNSVAELLEITLAANALFYAALIFVLTSAVKRLRKQS